MKGHWSIKSCFFNDKLKEELFRFNCLDEMPAWFMERPVQVSSAGRIFMRGALKATAIMADEW